mmetsp:Transcript_81702/g.243612  ORF Transcript_81702/g.243612 Transcript_81702/m.243612 type:complete len:683 (+) Transcript_81702:75-2123(+)
MLGTDFRRTFLHSFLALTAFLWPQRGLSAAREWWYRPWHEQWVPVVVAGQNFQVLARRIGRGSVKLFCVQGGPGNLFWDLNFLAVYLDLARYEVIQYNPLGAFPSNCSHPAEPCTSDPSWMTVESFVDTMAQVHRDLALPKDGIIVAHGFGVVQALEFMRRSLPQRRAAGVVLSDWVPSQAEFAKRRVWCQETGWRFCDSYTKGGEEPWHRPSPAQPLLDRTMWGPWGNGTGGVLEGWDVREHLGDLTGIPTLSMVGGDDIVFPMDVFHMSRQLEGQYGLLIGAGHFAFVDQLDRWLTLFETFVESIFGGDQGVVVRTVQGRRYLLRLPDTYDAAKSHSLVVGLHGLASTPEGAPFFDKVARRPSEVIFAFPEGLGDSPDGASFRTWNGSGSVGSPGPNGPTCINKEEHHCFDSCQALGGCWDNCWLTTCADDVGFISSMLDDIEKDFSIDAASVHAVGFSGGGWMAIELGTNPRVAHRFRSIVAIAGVPFRGFNRPPAVRPGARFLGIYGRGDTIVPAFPRQPGSAAALGNRSTTEALASTGWIFNTWENTTHLWASTLGCKGVQQSRDLRPADEAAKCYDYPCPEGGRVSACLWEGEHELPFWAEHLAWEVLFPKGESPPGVEVPVGLLSSLCLGIIALVAAVVLRCYLRTKKRPGLEPSGVLFQQPADGSAAFIRLEGQ